MKKISPFNWWERYQLDEEYREEVKRKAREYYHLKKYGYFTEEPKPLIVNGKIKFRKAKRTNNG